MYRMESIRNEKITKTNKAGIKCTRILKGPVEFVPVLLAYLAFGKKTTTGYKQTVQPIDVFAVDRAAKISK